MFEGLDPVVVTFEMLLPARGEKMLPVPVELLFVTGLLPGLTFPVFSI